MSLLWADGFENSSLWSRKYTLAGTTLPATSTARNGNGCLLAGLTIPASIHRLGLDAHATLVVGFAFRAESATSFPATSTDPFIWLTGDGGSVWHGGFHFSANTGGNLIATRAGTTLGTSSGLTFTNGIWYYLEVLSTLSDASGVVTVKVNGTTILSLTSQDNKVTSVGSTYDSVKIAGRTSTSTGMLIDDLYICNGAGGQYDTFLGDVTVETLRPNGNGNSSQFVGSDANSTDNYLLVDEATYDAADYVQSGTTNNKDLYTYGDLAAAAGSVKGVVVNGVLSKTASGAQAARQITRVASTNYNGSSVDLNTSDVVYAQAWEENPNTTNDWSISEVNGAEFGVEVL